MNFSAWAIAKPTPSILLFIMLTVAGLISFNRLGIENFPDMDFPTASIVASLPGASPAQLEAEVARPIEDSISSVGDVRHVTTTVNDGSVSMIVEFAYDKDLQEAITELRDAVTRIRSNLPSELQEPVISRISVVGLPVVAYAVSASDMDEADLSWFVDDVIGKRLMQVRGVAEVRRQGGVSREIRIELDPVRLWDPLESTCRHASLSIL